MFQFLCRFASFINFSSFKPDTENVVGYAVAEGKLGRSSVEL